MESNKIKAVFSKSITRGMVFMVFDDNRQVIHRRLTCRSNDGEFLTTFNDKYDVIKLSALEVSNGSIALEILPY